MPKKVINTPLAPAPIGPYNQANWFNGFLFISGQIALDPASGDLVNANLEEETRQVLRNIRAILHSLNAEMNDIVKTSIFLTDMGNFSRVNAVYGEFFEKDKAPARETVQVSALPRNVSIEISAIAAVPKLP